MSDEAMDTLRRASDASLRVTFGPSAISNGSDYARERRVTGLRLEENPAGALIRARVRGTRMLPYDTLVTVRTNGVITSRCSCPVRTNCKHGVAVLMAARAAATPQVSPWRRAMTDLTAQAGADQEEAVPLALQVERSLYGPPRIRPLTMGARGKWVKTGANWDDLFMALRVSWREDQRSALYGLGRLRNLSYSAYTSGGGSSGDSIDQFGPHVWIVLQQLAELGVEFVPGPDTPPVRLLDDAHIVTRVSTTADGVELVTAVAADGREWENHRLALLGDPVHGVVINGDGELLMGGFARPLSSVQRSLVNAHSHIDVPADDVASFATGFLPTLRRAVPVTVDPDVDLPQVGKPRLTLSVTFQPEHVTEIGWGFRYPVGESTVDVGLERAASDPLIRATDAEASLLTLIPDEDPWGWISRDGERYVAPTSTATGAASAQFVSHWLPRFEAMPAVIVLTGGERPQYRYDPDGATVSVSVTDPEDGAGDWFNLGIQVRVGDEEVDFGPLFAAVARGDTHLVLPSGTWFSLDRAELDPLRRIIEEANLLTPAGATGMELRVEHAGLWEELLELGVITEQSSTWRSSVAGLLDMEELPAYEVPDGVQATLRPYQVDGFRWLSFLWASRLGGILADDMGLGKTVQLLTAITKARRDDPDGPPVLVVAPTSVMSTWASQAATFVPDLRVEVVARTKAKRFEGLDAVRDRSDVVVTSYTLLRLGEDEYADQTWAAVILDEAQFVKNRQASTYKAVRRLRARVKFAVTGTPLENNLMDLWSMLSITAPGLFTSPDAFTELYRRPIESGSDPEALGRLRRRIRPLMLRRAKGDVATELPPKQEQVLQVPLSPGHRKVYDRHLAAVRKQVLGLTRDMDKNRIVILQALTRLRQLSLSPSLVDPSLPPTSAKIDALVDMLTDMRAEGHRALVFSQFTSFLALVKQRLDEERIGYVYLDGRTRKRDERIEKFRDGDDPVFLISLKAGGFGLTLTEADYVFIMDPWWNPAAENQAVDRTHRIGQTSPVMVYRLVSEDTIEEKVVALQERKRDLFSTVVGRGELAAPLSAKDIRGLLDAG